MISVVGITSATFTTPSGFTQIGTPVISSAGNGAVGALFCKTASSESGNYNISWNNAGFFIGGMVQLSGTNCSGYDVGGSGNAQRRFIADGDRAFINAHS